MSTTKKLVIAVVALSVAMCCMIGGTLAWLISKPEPVVNTFTVGGLEITLDEAPVDANGKATSGDRVKGNAYHLLPNGEYDKDPIVHVAANNEKCYVFVKIENGLENIIAGTSIEDQILANGWTKLEKGVYYQVVNAATSATDLPVFKSFKITSDINKTDLAGYEDAEIKVTAYAIQYLGFEDNVANAWTTVSAASAN